MERFGCNSARRNRRNRRARNGPCQRTRIHTVAAGVIDNSLAPSRLVNAGVLNEELKFYSRRPRLKSVRPGQARHFARTPKVCSVSFASEATAQGNGACPVLLRLPTCLRVAAERRKGAAVRAKRARRW